ncbi:hypothetical protein ACFQ4O_03795 [Methylopila musalis]|uniref:Uncharacterized protein n=1 Tax=Methylopila musalis TaxID=1134781 RepID=A0ABW3Z5A0_9HYPH
MTEKKNFWNGLPKIVVTAEHVDRALRAMGNDITNLDQRDVHFEGAMLAGAVIAHMDALYEMIEMSSPVIALTAESFGHGFIEQWAIETYGLVRPTDEAAERASSERAQRIALRAAKAKATREAKRASEIEAAVAERLLAAA